jgi:hypothetical protein
VKCKILKRKIDLFIYLYYSYESLYQRQHRLREEKNARMYEPSPNPFTYKYEYPNHSAYKNSQVKNVGLHLKRYYFLKYE